MKNKLRKIKVQGQIFLWYYQKYVRYSPPQQSISRLYAFNENGLTIEIFFLTQDTWTGGNPLNEGVMVVNGNEEIHINLNRPRFVAELLELVLNKKSQSQQIKKIVIQNGKELIYELGYQEKDFNFFV